jgi:hypothetical protein
MVTKSTVRQTIRVLANIGIQPLGLEYLDLVRRAVETRHRARGDVELTDSAIHLFAVQMSLRRVSPRVSGTELSHLPPS